jgi:DNA-binding NarL/FixJ family response regulator
MALERRPKVLLADNHPGVLAALHRLLQPSCDVVGRVTDGAAIVEASTKLKPDVVVLDISMPHVDGLDACRQIKCTMPQTKVVVLTAANDAEIKDKAFSVGASAFVLKYLMADELVNAIETVLQGDTYSSLS